MTAPLVPLLNTPTADRYFPRHRAKSADFCAVDKWMSDRSAAGYRVRWWHVYRQAVGSTEPVYSAQRGLCAPCELCSGRSGKNQATDLAEIHCHSVETLSLTSATFKSEVFVTAIENVARHFAIGFAVLRKLRDAHSMTERSGIHTDRKN